MSSVLGAGRRLTKRLSKARRQYDSGNRALEKGELGAAENHVRAALTLELGNGPWIQRLGLILEKQGRYEEALTVYGEALTVDSTRAECHYRAGVCATKLNDGQLALDHFEAALSLDPGHSRAAKALVKRIPRGTPDWRRQQLLELACQSQADASGLVALAESYFAMKNYSECLRVLERAEQIQPLAEGEVVLSARAYIGLGNLSEAFTALSARAMASKNGTIQARGAGHFFHKTENWLEAEEMYQISWNGGDCTATIAFGIGYALSRQYRWGEALPWLSRALAMPGGDRPFWNYAYGLALERVGMYEGAVGAYSRALLLGEQKQKAWFYRLGASFFELGDYTNSFEALQEWSGRPSFSKDSISSKVDAGGQELLLVQPSFSSILNSLSVGSRERVLDGELPLREQIDHWLSLARCGSADREVDPLSCYTKLLKASGGVDLSIASEAAAALFDCGDERQACETLLNAAEFANTEGLNLKRLQKSAFDRRRMRYAEYSHRFKVNKRIVLFESFWGTKTNDSPLAIYEGMLRDSRFTDFEFYWSASTKAPISPRLKNDGRTFIIEYGSIAYDRILSIAGIIVTNTSMVEYFHRRDEQQVLNTWHGTPMKTLGKQIAEDPLGHANVARGFLNSSFLFLPNQHTARALVRDYDIEGLLDARVVIGGSPRLDRILDSTQEQRKQTLKQIGLDSSAPTRIIFYAPTWRGTNESREMDVDEVVDVLSVLSEVPDSVVLFRCHPIAEASLVGIDISGVVVPEEVDTYDVLACTDTLVTDYSSILFDFLPTGRRTIAYVPGVEAYGQERGLYLMPDELLEDVATDLEDLRRLIREADWAGPGQKYRASVKRYAQAEDGHATDRVLDLLAGSDTRGEVIELTPTSERKTVVLFESLLPNGIFSALSSLVESDLCDQYRFILTMNASATVKDPVRLQNLDAISGLVQVVARTGQMANDPEERYALQAYSQQGRDIAPSLMSFVNRAYIREFRRVFGTPIDAAFIDFEGYNEFWSALFAKGVPGSCESGVIIHNQIVDEKEQKFPYLEKVFASYTEMGGVGAVSTELARENERRLSEIGYEISSGIKAVHNILDVSKIRAQAESGVDLWRDFPNANPRLVTMGRFSPEKNQELLLRSMPEVRRHFPSAELLLLGEGLTLNPLRLLAVQLGIDDVVHFCGFMENPMTTLAKSDLFVLSSKREGQPMVLLEAMSLGIPVVCTDVPGSVEAVQNNGGTITGWTPEEFAQGIVEAMAAGTREDFHVDDYNRSACSEFADFVTGLL